MSSNSPSITLDPAEIYIGRGVPAQQLIEACGLVLSWVIDAPSTSPSFAISTTATNTAAAGKSSTDSPSTPTAASPIQAIPTSSR